MCSDACTEKISSDMSSETLERILNVTLSEPMLEGVFPVVQPATVAGPTAACASNMFTPTSTSISVELKTSQPTDTNQADLFPSEHEIDNFLDQIHQ